MAIVFRYKRFSDMHPEFTSNEQYTNAINKLKKEGKKNEANKLIQERNRRFNKDGSPKTPSKPETSSTSKSESKPKTGKYYTEEEVRKIEESLKKSAKKELEEATKKAAEEARGWKGLSTKNKALLGAGSVAALGAAGLIGHGLTRRQRD